MFEPTQIRPTLQRSLCFALAAAIVAISLSFGAYATRAAIPDYTVTITQLS